jgi:hypothetical protein
VISCHPMILSHRLVTIFLTPLIVAHNRG